MALTPCQYLKLQYDKWWIHSNSIQAGGQTVVERAKKLHASQRPQSHYQQLPQKVKNMLLQVTVHVTVLLTKPKIGRQLPMEKKRWRHKTFIPLHIQDIYTPSYLVHRVKAAYFVFSKAKRPTPTPLSSRAITNAWAASLCQRVLCILSKKWPRVQWHSHQARCSKFPVITLPWCPTAWGSKDGPRS